MYNECPNVLKTFTGEVNEKFKLVPPRIRCRNSAERAIRNFKEHFITRLASTHKDFPLHIWCQVLPHASLTLNLLRKSCMNPKLYLISRCKQNTVPNFALAAQYLQVKEANTVTPQIYGIAQEYRHLVKGPG